MKSDFFFGIVSMFLLSSCVEMSTTLELDSLTDLSETAFTATTETAPSTRTSLSGYTNADGCYSLYWSSGDEISISDGDKSAVYVTNDDSSSTAEFSHKEGNINNSAATYTAFYPSSITASNIVLPSTQNYMENNVENFPMYAVSTNKELAFKNLCGIIRLCIKAEESGEINISSISLSGNKGMSGTFTIGEDNSAIVSGTDGVVLNCAEAHSLYTSSATDFNIVVPQGDFNPLKIKICDTYGKEINFESEGTISVKRSEITRINLTISKSDFETSLEAIPITDSDVEFTER